MSILGGVKIIPSVVSKAISGLLDPNPFKTSKDPLTAVMHFDEIRVETGKITFRYKGESLASMEIDIGIKNNDTLHICSIRGEMDIRIE